MAVLTRFASQKNGLQLLLHIGVLLMDIELTIKNYRCFSDSQPLRFRLHRGFTALIGINNSGKSTLLKFFYEFRNLFAQISADPPKELHTALRRDAVPFAFPPSIQDFSEIFCNLNDRDLEIHLHFVPSNEDKFGDDYVTDLTLKVRKNRNQYYATARASNGFEDFNQLGLMHNYLVNASIGPSIKILLDPLNSLKKLVNTFYIGSFRNALGMMQPDQPYYDLEIGRALVARWHQLKVGDRRKDANTAVRLTGDIRRLFGFKSLEINASTNLQRLLVTINSRPFWLEELGSGIAQFVVVLINLAGKRPAFILVDEPELNLHPALQSRFLSVLGSYAEEGVIFATHSIGLARSEGNWVYSLTKQRDDSAALHLYESTPNLAEFLGELSFSQYRELGVDKILLVEGVTEVKTIRQFLRFYRKENEFLLIPLGGAAMINKNRDHELEEIKKISTKIFALIDSEKATEDAPLSEERKAFVETCRKLKIRCHVLERRATENYLCERAIKEVKGDKFKELAPFDSLQKCEYGWAKADNWLIATKMTKDDLAETDLGQFLESL